MIYFVFNTVSNNNSVTANVNHSKLTALEEKVNSKIFHWINIFVQFNFLIYRHCSKSYNAVNVAVNCAYIIFYKKFMHALSGVIE